MTRAEELLSLYEATVHRVISFLRGHREVRKTCGHGYRKVGNQCHHMTPMERVHMRKGHKRAWKKNRVHQGRIERRRLRSLMRRVASGY